MILPQGLTLALMQTRWAQILQAVLTSAIVPGVTFANVSLAATTPKAIQINIGRVPQGWFLIDNSANAVVWRTQPFNEDTLTLEASAATTVSIWVF